MTLANPPYFDTALHFVQDLYIAWYSAPGEAAAFYTGDASFRFAQDSETTTEVVGEEDIRAFYAERFHPARVDIATFDPMVVMYSRDGDAETHADIPAADLHTPYALLINVHGQIQQGSEPAHRFIHTIVLSRGDDATSYRIRNDMFRIMQEAKPANSDSGLVEAAVNAAAVVEETKPVEGAPSPELPREPVAVEPIPVAAETEAAITVPAVEEPQPAAVNVETPAAATKPAEEPVAAKAPPKAPSSAPPAPKSWAAITAKQTASGSGPAAAVAVVTASARPAAPARPAPAAPATVAAQPKPAEESARGRSTGGPVSPTVAAPPAAGKEDTEVFIKGLQRPISTDALKKAFEEAVGPVVAVMVPFPDRDFGYVEFRKLEDTRKAIQLGALPFQGKSIKIVAKRARSRSRGRNTGTRPEKKAGAGSRRKEATEVPEPSVGESK